MKKIAILGAGRSSSSLIRYLLEQSEQYSWKIRVCDYDLEIAKQKVNNHPNAEAVKFDVFDHAEVEREIGKADLVLSMCLPECTSM